MASNNVVASDDFLFRFGYYFNIFAVTDKIHTNMLEILQCMRTRMWLLKFLEVFEKISSREDFYLI